MQISEECVSWLTESLRSEIIIEARLFGSAIGLKKSFSDVDIFLKYRNGFSEEISLIRKKMEMEFHEKFKTPLHFLALSEIEIGESSCFLDVALKNSIGLI